MENGDKEASCRYHSGGTHRGGDVGGGWRGASCPLAHFASLAEILVTCIFYCTFWSEISQFFFRWCPKSG